MEWKTTKTAKCVKALKISLVLISKSTMESTEQGFSGAALIRLDVVFYDGRQGSFICKKADLKERMVMRTLTEQGHQYTPAAYSEDCVSDEPMWMIQQDLARRINAPHDNLQWMERVADALAEIHGNNMDRGKEMPYIIDFGFARYAPFYIDLVDYFSFENAALYHKALTSRGFSLYIKDFEERFRAAFQYPCFVYMFPSIMQWKNGSEERLLKMLHRIFSC